MFGIEECYLFIAIFLIISFALIFPPGCDRINECNTFDSGTKMCQILILASYVFVVFGVIIKMNRVKL
jgi:hypothetical protein